jgi:endonuclease G, mitochondrial
MTNMIPQAPNHNRQTWANLEDYTRDLVQAGMEVYVVMGSYGSGGAGSNGAMQTIDNGKVTVPSMIWKILVLLPEGENDMSRISSSIRVIAVNTPNINSINTDWGGYRTSVDAIEQATGYNLLSNLPDQVENVLESKVDTGPTK